MKESTQNEGETKIRLNTRFPVRQIVVLVFVLIILSPILFVAVPGAAKAQ